MLKPKTGIFSPGAKNTIPAMDNEPCQQTLTPPPAAKEKTLLTDAAAKGIATQVLTVPEFASAAEVAAFSDQLISVLENKPKSVTLRLIVPHHLQPDSALILEAVLASRGGGMPITTEAWSPVLGPSVLLWLKGNVRLIRRTDYLYFRLLSEAKRRKQHRPLWEDDFNFMDGYAEPGINLCVTDYETVLRPVGEFPPVDQLADKIITPDMLKELGLLGGGPLDDLLEECMAPESVVDARGSQPEDSK